VVSELLLLRGCVVGFLENAGARAVNGAIDAVSTRATAAVTDIEAAGAPVIADGKLVASATLSKAAVLLDRALGGGMQIIRLAMIALSATTAIAAGFLAGIGLEFIAFVDKWTIVTNILFYFMIASALLSPFLALPHTIQEFHRRDQKHREDRTEEARITHEKRKEAGRKNANSIQVEIDTISRDLPRLEIQKKYCEKLQETTVGELKRLLTAEAAIPQRTWYQVATLKPNPRAKVQQGIRSAEQEKLKLDENASKAKAEFESKQKQEKELIEKKREHDRTANEAIQELQSVYQERQVPFALKALLGVAYSVYVIMTLFGLLNVVNEWLALYLVVATIVLIGIAVFRDFGLIAPWATAHVLILGFGIGSHAYTYERNVKLEIRGEDALQVRVLLATGEGLIVMKDTGSLRVPGRGAFVQPTQQCARTERAGELAFIPKDALGFAYLPAPGDALAQMYVLKPFCWWK
jgi:hypothetical protein